MLFGCLSPGLGPPHRIDIASPKRANHKAAFLRTVIVIMSRLLLEVVNKYVLDLLSVE